MKLKDFYGEHEKEVLIKNVEHVSQCISINAVNTDGEINRSYHYPGPFPTFEGRGIFRRIEICYQIK